MARIFRPSVYKEYVEGIKKQNEDVVIQKRLRGGIYKPAKVKITDVFDNYFRIKYDNYYESIMYKELFTGECLIAAGEQTV